MMQDEYTTEADVPAADEETQSAAEIPATLKMRLDAETARADENYNKFLIAMADFENYKKRIERQFTEIALAGRKRLMETLLPVLDNLERALAHEDASAEALRSGVQQTMKGFEAVLAMEGVKAFTVMGQKFDPKTAEAIGTQAADGVEDDVVIAEAQKGYLIGEEMLRPAKVIVAKRSE
jgi:molecular chaperone GrpE